MNLFLYFFAEERDAIEAIKNGISPPVESKIESFLDGRLGIRGHWEGSEFTFEVQDDNLETVLGAYEEFQDSCYVKKSGNNFDGYSYYRCEFGGSSKSKANIDSNRVLDQRSNYKCTDGFRALALATGWKLYLKGRLYFLFISGPFPVHFRFISGSFPVYFLFISGPFPVHFRSISGSFTVHYRFIQLTLEIGMNALVQNQNLDEIKVVSGEI